MDVASSTRMFRFDLQLQLIKPLFVRKSTTARRIFVKHLPNEAAYPIGKIETDDNRRYQS